MCVDHIFIRMSGRCAEINLAQILRYVGGFCGAVVTGISLFMLIAFSYSFSQTKQVIALIYCVFLGLMIVIAEIRIEMFLKWFAFLSRPVGLGLFYFFVGGLALGNNWWEIVIGCVMCVIGIVYVLLGVCCQDINRAPNQAAPKAEVVVQKP